MYSNGERTAIVVAYATAALWSSTDANDDPLNFRFDIYDISPRLWKEMSETVNDFVDGNAEDLGDMAPDQVGHDLWLTRSRHGTGFWDRGLGARGERLTAAAHAYGEQYLFVGNDGMIHA